MLKRILYTVINIVITVLIFLFFRFYENEKGNFVIFISTAAFIVLLVFASQIILLVIYGLRSNKNFDFIFIFTSFYSVLYIIPYAIFVISLINVRQSILELREELGSAMGPETFDEMANDNPFWGIHAILLIPIAIQALVLILRIRRNKLLNRTAF